MQIFQWCEDSSLGHYILLIPCSDISIGLVWLLSSLSLTDCKSIAAEICGGLLSDRGQDRYKNLGDRLWSSSKGIRITHMTSCIWFDILYKMGIIATTQDLFED